MRRVTLSVFSLGLALTLLVAGSTFAAFTDTASDSGTVPLAKPRSA